MEVQFGTLCMQEKAFQAIHTAENSWWYHARIFAIKRILSYFKAKNETICDVGAGYGAMCPGLKSYGRVSVFEPEADARKKCLEMCDEVFGSESLEEFTKNQEKKFSLVTLFDVIEHVEDDLKFISDVSKLIPEGGHVFVTVPAFQFLWSELDVLAMHFRRYKKAQIVALLERAGFEIEYASYWNMMLIIPALIVRKGTGKAGYSAFSMPRWIDRLFFEWVRLESCLMPHVSLPFGTSVFVYARKK